MWHDFSPGFRNLLCFTAGFCAVALLALAMG